MWTTDSNHGAQTQFHSGRHQNDGDFPNLGAWVHYGLGSLNDNLPQFISIGTREYWNKKDGHYLGPAHDAVPLRIDPDNPLDFGRPERPFSAEAQAVGMDLIGDSTRCAAPSIPHDSGAGGPHRLLRTGVPHAAVGARSGRLLAGDRRDPGALRARPAALPRVRHADAGRPAAGRTRRALHPDPARRRRRGAWDAHGGLKANHERNALAVDQPIGGAAGGSRSPRAAR